MANDAPGTATRWKLCPGLFFAAKVRYAHIQNIPLFSA